MKDKCLKIKEKRLEMGLTQVQLSKILYDAPLSTIKKWDSNVMYPPPWVEKLILEKLERVQQEQEM